MRALFGPCLALSAALLLVSACSGSGGPDFGTPAPGEGSSSSGSSGDTASPDGPSSSSSSSTSSSSSSGGSSGSSGSSGTPAKDTRLFPVAVGRSWSYTNVSTSAGQTTTSTGSTTITAQTMIDGHDAWVVSSTASGQTYTSHADVQGDDIWFRSATDGFWMQTSKAPVQEGATWTYSYYGTRQQTWHKAPTTKVAAGTFDDCWRLDYFVAESMKPGDVNYSVLCRGIGTVLVVTQLSSGYSMRQELTGKSF